MYREEHNKPSNNLQEIEINSLNLLSEQNASFTIKSEIHIMEMLFNCTENSCLTLSNWLRLPEQILFCSIKERNNFGDTSYLLHKVTMTSKW